MGERFQDGNVYNFHELLNEVMHIHDKKALMVSKSLAINTRMHAITAHTCTHHWLALK